ncbi:MAG: hypothetical protein WCT12_07395 [Verrucomicrobiota bacterium]|jgi:hypothetical protein
MNEPPQDVVLDSNAYFRLAQSVRPLLQQCFGASPAYSLHVLAELDDEYRTSTRLRHKFEWVGGTEYRQDRQLKRYELHVECWSTIKLLWVMLTAARINMDKVVEIIEYWDYEKDLPMPKEKLRKVFVEYFGTDCPI